jgi:selenocysteine lyase/cysteine desulfurase
MGMEPGNSAIVTVLGDVGALREAGIQAAKPAGLVRVGFHLYNDEEDADRVASVLGSG